MYFIDEPIIRTGLGGATHPCSMWHSWGSSSTAGEYTSQVRSEVVWLWSGRAQSELLAKAFSSPGGPLRGAVSLPPVKVSGPKEGKEAAGLSLLRPGPVNWHKSFPPHLVDQSNQRSL